MSVADFSGFAGVRIAGVHDLLLCFRGKYRRLHFA